MPWTEDEVREIIGSLDPIPLLWLLIMHRGDGETGVHVGTGKAKNAVKLYSKVRSYAKNRGMSPPPDEKQVKQGYTSLLNTPVRHPDLGRATMIKGDKPEYLKLTDVSKRLVTRMHTEQNLKEFAKSEAGLDVDAEPEAKWPEEYDDAASVLLTPTEVVSGLDQPFELPTHAEFTCPVCSNTVSHEYEFEYPTEAWSEYAAAECEGCGTTVRHEVGNPYSQIDLVE